MKTNKKITLRCVQCGREMEHGTDWDKFVPVCNYPDCPNYGLLQMGVEVMSNIKK